MIATFYGDHENHEPSMRAFLQLKKPQAGCAAHSLAEVYAVLTGMPGKQRVSGDQCMLFIENIRERLTIVGLDHEDYLKALEWSASKGIAGGGIYDALLAFCALKVSAKSLLTWNLKDFQRLGPELSKLVKQPS